MTTDTQALAARFHQAMLDIYNEADRKYRYRPLRFKQMVIEQGGVQAAKRLLASPTPSEGFTELLLLGRPDLTMEALVLQPEYSALFTPEELAMARRHLGRDK